MVHAAWKIPFKCDCGADYRIMALYASCMLDVYVSLHCPYCGKDDELPLNMQSLVDWAFYLDQRSAVKREGQQ